MKTPRLGNIRLVRGHSILVESEHCPLFVIDAGAHKCEFANILASKLNADVLALEPNKSLDVPFVHPSVNLLQCALSHCDGAGILSVDQNPEASSISAENHSLPSSQIHSLHTRLRSLASLVDEFGIDQIDILKLDIEGAEYDVIGSMSKMIAHKISQITIEFHPYNASGDSLIPIFESFSRLSSLGFYACRSSFSGYGDILFLNSLVYKQPSQSFKSLLPYLRKLLVMANN